MNMSAETNALLNAVQYSVHARDKDMVTAHATVPQYQQPMFYFDYKAVHPHQIFDDKPNIIEIQHSNMAQVIVTETLPDLAPNQATVIGVPNPNVASMGPSVVVKKQRAPRRPKAHAAKPMKIFDCPHCSKRFRRSDDFKKHLRVHNGEKPYECPHCKKGFTQSNDLARHIRIHTGEKPFECMTCNKKFRASNDLSRHMRIHTGEKPYECKHCQMRFSRSSVLRDHVRIHTGERPYECPECKKAFSRRGVLRIHMQRHDRGTVFECPTCDRRFPDSAEFSEHMLAHCTDMPFECNKCSERFPNIDALRKHVQIHLEGKPFECAICNKRYRELNDLIDHVKFAHEKDPATVKPPRKNAKSNNSNSKSNSKSSKTSYGAKIKCPKCPKIVATKNNLASHLNFKHKIKAYECETCGKRFVSRDYYARHVAKHELTCHVCGKLFRSAGTLKKHLRVKHEVTSNGHVDEVDARKLTKKRKVLERKKKSRVKVKDEPDVEGDNFGSDNGFYNNELNGDQTNEPNSGDEKWLVNSRDNDVTNSRAYPCAHCHLSFATESMLFDHVTRLHGTERNDKQKSRTSLTYECTMCRERFDDYGDFKQHMSAHDVNANGDDHVDDDDKFECETCSRRFTRAANYKEHLRTHILMKENYKCEKCNKKFSSLSELKEHHACVHVDNSDYFSCKYCNQHFDDARSRNKHMVQKHLKKAYECTLCHKQFVKLCHLEEHLKLHSKGKKVFVCTVCDKFYKKKENLDNHNREFHQESVEPDIASDFVIKEEPEDVIEPNSHDDDVINDLKPNTDTNELTI